MKELQYVGATLVLSDSGAEAVLAYAEALAQGATSGIIDIPILRSDGSRDVANLLLGPASQLFVASRVGPNVELDDAPEIEIIAALTRALGPTRAEALPAPAEVDHIPAHLV